MGNERIKLERWHGAAVTDDVRAGWVASAVEALEEGDAEIGDHHFTISGDSMVIAMKNGAEENGLEHVEVFDVVIRRRATVFSEASRMDASAKLHAHVGTCDQCSGPNDGCEKGQDLEGLCITQMGFSPYEPPYNVGAGVKPG